MIFLKRKRLIFWLLKAYIKKWGKTIFASFVLGFALIIILFLNRNFIISRLPIIDHEHIGIAGIYSERDLPNNLPEAIATKTSRGLTKVTKDGKVVADLAKSWEVKDEGKTFIFYLNEGVKFSDGKEVDSKSINYNFADVLIERPAKHVIVFKLKDKYSPFLVTLANYKVYKKNLIGVSNYKIEEIKTNGEFIRSIEISNRNEKEKIQYVFYDTQAALKHAYVLGEVTSIVDINNLDYERGVSLGNFKNTKVLKNINETKIVTLFFNNSDSTLSDKKIRKALAYSLPDSFEDGKRTHTPYKDGYWFNNPTENFKKDLEYVAIQLEDTEATNSGMKINLKTLPQYENLAKEISKYWKAIGIQTEIERVEGLPVNYQVFLGELPVLKDPDQYTLWHTGQQSNITNYRNLRIDKLLEDGRQIYATEERKKIYDDFQKYLIDDMPAAFLFFPYTYTLNRN